MINEEYLNKYAECMEEIKKRMKVVRAFTDGSANAIYKQTTAESTCLQIRKILELIALSSLVANKEAYAKSRKKFATDWHAKRILSDINTINPDFYPVPTRQILDSSGKKVIEVKKIESGFLTKNGFEKIYDRCGGLLHASNPFSKSKDIDNFLKLVPKWMDKIKNLLNHHQVQLIQSDLQLWVLMQAEKDGKVHVTLFQRLEENA